MAERVYNFYAGPATLPHSVIKKAAEDVLEFEDMGMSILEISHRSKQASALFEKVEKDLLELMSLSDSDYKVLFLGGGASSQFAMIPMNFLTKDTTVDFVDTGTWSTNAIKEAKIIWKCKYCSNLC